MGPAFDRRCIPSGVVAPPSHTPGMLGRRASPDGRLAALGAAPPFMRWVLVSPSHEDRAWRFVRLVRRLWMRLTPTSYGVQSADSRLLCSLHIRHQTLERTYAALGGGRPCRLVAASWRHAAKQPVVQVRIRS